jgi:Ca2+-binding EF-hand superfamily protein
MAIDEIVNGLLETGSSVYQSIIHHHLVAPHLPGEGEGADADDAVFIPTAYELAILILVLITLLVIVTIVFEFMKDYAIDSTNKFTRPIVLTLFGEMTVLGFLSVVTFIVGYGGGLDDLSEDLFGDTAEGYVENTLETIHYSLFLVMILTIIQVFSILAIGHAADDKFERFNEVAQHEDNMLKILKKAELLNEVNTASWLYDYLVNPYAAWIKHTEFEEIEQKILFYSLRKEQIMRRSPQPPFEVMEEAKHLPPNFDFAMYQSINLSTFLIKVVNFTPWTWFGLFILLCFTTGILCAVGKTYTIFAFVWVVMGLIDIMCMVMLVNHSITIYRDLLNPVHLRPDHLQELQRRQKKKEKKKRRLGDASTMTSNTNSPRPGDIQRETTSGTDNSGDEVFNDVDDRQAAIDAIAALSKDEMDTVSQAHSEVIVPPPICKNPTHLIVRLKQEDLDKPFYTKRDVEPPGFVSEMLLGKQPPNRHEQLFLFDRLGPQMNVYFLRLHLLVQSIYFSVFLCFLVPYIFEKYPIWVGVIYLAVGLLPLPIQYVFLYPLVVFYMPTVAATGLMREGEIETEVVRMQKLRKIVKLMTMLAKIDIAKSIAEGEGPDMNDEKVKKRVEELSRIYHENDRSGVGQVRIKEFRAMAAAVGEPAEGQELKEAFEGIVDNSGFIALDRFIRWGLISDRPMEEIAERIFRTLDDDDSGELSLDEFVVGLKRFNEPPYNANLSDSELLAIVRDFDTDGSGTIDFEEFMDVVAAATD